MSRGSPCAKPAQPSFSCLRDATCLPQVAMGRWRRVRMDIICYRCPTCHPPHKFNFVDCAIDGRRDYEIERYLCTLAAVAASVGLETLSKHMPKLAGAPIPQSRAAVECGLFVL